jgi:DNA-directed RNA polymerase specialized sigma24 family protein
MKLELEALRAGKINFNDFVRKTSSEWERLAAKLFRAYPSPDGVEVDDIFQEMVLHAWRAAVDWDSERGSDLTRYVTWTAYAYARRWLNGQRNAYRRSDHSPGRFPLSESATKGEREDWSLGDLLIVDATEEEADARRIFSRIVCRLEDPGQVMALEAWAVAGSSSAAVALLQADPKIVAVLNLWTPGAAQRLVTQAIESATHVVAGIA